MEMYDMINDCHVQCFQIPVLGMEAYAESLDDPIYCNGGDSREFNVGDKVPWQAPNYNYGPDFNILDIDGIQDPSADYKYRLHIIRNGKVKDTLQDCCKNEDFDCPVVINMWGELLTVRSEAEIFKYAEEWNKLLVNIDKQYQTWEELFQESLRVGNELTQVTGMKHKERKELKEKYNRLEEQIDTEEAACDERVEKLKNAFQNKWCIPVPEDCIKLGQWIAIRNHAEEQKKDPNCKNPEQYNQEIQTAEKIIQAITSADPTMLTRHEKWQRNNPGQEKRV